MVLSPKALFNTVDILELAMKADGVNVFKDYVQGISQDTVDELKDFIKEIQQSQQQVIKQLENAILSNGVISKEEVKKQIRQIFKQPAMKNAIHASIVEMVKDRLSLTANQRNQWIQGMSEYIKEFYVQ